MSSLFVCFSLWCVIVCLFFPMTCHCLFVFSYDVSLFCLFFPMTCHCLFFPMTCHCLFVFSYDVSLFVCFSLWRVIVCLFVFPYDVSLFVCSAWKSKGTKSTCIYMYDMSSLFVCFSERVKEQIYDMSSLFVCLFFQKKYTTTKWRRNNLSYNTYVHTCSTLPQGWLTITYMYMYVYTNIP